MQVGGCRTAPAYVADRSLGRTACGCLATDAGAGASTVDAGGYGAATDTRVAVMGLLLPVDARSKGRLLYDLNGKGSVDAVEAGYRAVENDVFDAVNRAGCI